MNHQFNEKEITSIFWANFHLDEPSFGTRITKPCTQAWLTHFAKHGKGR